MLVQYGYILYYGWFVNWTDALIIAAAGFFSIVTIVLFRAIIPYWILSLLGFLVCPITVYLMYINTPVG